MVQSYDDLVTLHMQLQNEHATLRDHQNIKAEMDQASPKEQGLAEAEGQSRDVKLVKPEINMIPVVEKSEELIALTSTFNPHESSSANFSTEGRDSTLQGHTQKKRSGDGDENQGPVKKPRRIG